MKIQIFQLPLEFPANGLQDIKIPKRGKTRTFVLNKLNYSISDLQDSSHLSHLHILSKQDDSYQKLVPDKVRYLQVSLVVDDFKEQDEMLDKNANDLINQPFVPPKMPTFKKRRL